MQNCILSGVFDMLDIVENITLDSINETAKQYLNTIVLLIAVWR